MTGKEPGKDVAIKRIVHLSLWKPKKNGTVMNLTKKRKKERWFIGLKIVDGSHAWCWLSGSIAYVNENSSGTWRWNKGEPNHLETEKCVEMWQNGKYNNMMCRGEHYDENPGYICEKQVSKFDSITNHSKKKESCKRALTFKRVTRIHIFFLVCSTISNKSENDAILIEGTARPRSIPQPLATTTKSFTLRTELMITRNKLLSEGKIYFDRNLTFNMTNNNTLLRSSRRMSQFQTPLRSRPTLERRKH